MRVILTSDTIVFLLYFSFDNTNKGQSKLTHWMLTKELWYGQLRPLFPPGSSLLTSTTKLSNTPSLELVRMLYAPHCFRAIYNFNIHWVIATFYSRFPQSHKTLKKVTPKLQLSNTALLSFTLAPTVIWIHLCTKTFLSEQLSIVRFKGFLT